MILRYDWFWFAVWLAIIAAATAFAIGVKP
jgi:hypothetical protein